MKELIAILKEAREHDVPYGITADRIDSLYSGGVSEEDKQKWKLFSEIGYKVEENIQIKLGLEGGYVQDKVRTGQDNYSYGASCQVEIRF